MAAKRPISSRWRPLSGDAGGAHALGAAGGGARPHHRRPQRRHRRRAAGRRRVRRGCCGLIEHGDEHRDGARRRPRRDLCRHDRARALERKWTRAAAIRATASAFVNDRVRAEAVSPHRARPEPGVRNRPVPAAARVHADACARWARSSTTEPVSSRGRSRWCRRPSNIRVRAGSSSIDEFGAITSASARAREAQRLAAGRRRRDLAGRAAAAVFPRRSKTGISATAATLGRRTAELHLALAGDTRTARSRPSR